MTTLTYAATAATRRLPQWAQLVPGTLLLAVVGFAGKMTEQSIAAYGRAHHLTLPNIEYVLWAIVFGLIVVEHGRRAGDLPRAASTPTSSGSRPASCCWASGSCSATSSSWAASAWSASRSSSRRRLC